MTWCGAGAEPPQSLSAPHARYRRPQTFPHHQTAPRRHSLTFPRLHPSTFPIVILNCPNRHPQLSHVVIPNLIGDP